MLIMLHRRIAIYAHQLPNTDLMRASRGVEKHPVLHAGIGMKSLQLRIQVRGDGIVPLARIDPPDARRGGGGIKPKSPPLQIDLLEAWDLDPWGGGACVLRARRLARLLAHIGQAREISPEKGLLLPERTWPL